MKMFIAFDLGMECGVCFAFTAHVDPLMLAGWMAGGSNIMSNLEQRIRRALGNQGISSLPMTYIVETRTKWNKAPTRPHLHGIVLCERSGDQTRFKVALEKALFPALKWQGKGRPVKVEPAYDKDAQNLGEFAGRGVWPSYITKNAQRYDARLGKRRVFFSQSLIELARDAWALRREE
ncbi:hypothetical protein [Sphingomonas sp. PB4P5]|uniref:hypothetical protein n=1 Tax=Parasphingomonas puruogangriensis TaxID=3096155 RepID=UPI002FCA5117